MAAPSPGASSSQMESGRAHINNNKSIDTLPDEVLLSILQRIGCDTPLPQPRDPCQNPSRYIWRHFGRFPDRLSVVKVTSTVLSALVCKRWRILANRAVLTISFANNDASDEFSNTANRFPNLHSLHFHNIFFPNTDFPYSLSFTTAALQTLEFEHCSYKDGKNFINCLAGSLTRWTALQRLALGRILCGVDLGTALRFLRGVSVLPSLRDFSFTLMDCDDILGEIEETVGQMTQLRSLGLAVQDLWFGYCMSRLTSLMSFSLDNSSPAVEDLMDESELRAVISQCQLETFRISNSCVEVEIAEKLRSLPRLRVFTLEDIGCWSGFFSEALGEMTNLEELHLRLLHVMDDSDGRLIPESVASLKKLKILRVVDCADVACLPESLGRLESLRELRLDGCVSIKKLPESVGSLSSLQVLSLRGCHSLSSIPETIASLASLHRLHLSGGVSSLTLSHALKTLHQLRVLALVSCYNLDTLPASLGCLLKLRELSVEDCAALRLLPESLGQLSDLRMLSVHRCPSLERLPTSLGTQRLLEVELTECIGLRELPPALLQSLQIQSLKLVRRSDFTNS